VNDAAPDNRIGRGVDVLRSTFDVRTKNAERRTPNGFTSV